MNWNLLDIDLTVFNGEGSPYCRSLSLRIDTSKLCRLNYFWKKATKKGEKNAIDIIDIALKFLPKQLFLNSRF